MKSCLGIETIGCRFHIVNNWLVRLTPGLISLVNDNHVKNNRKESLVYVYFGSIVKIDLNIEDTIDLNYGRYCLS